MSELELGLRELRLEQVYGPFGKDAGLEIERGGAGAVIAETAH